MGDKVFISCKKVFKKETILCFNPRGGITIALLAICRRKCYTVNNI